MIICLPSKPTKRVSPTLSYSPRFLRRSFIVICIYLRTRVVWISMARSRHGSGHFTPVIIIKLCWVVFPICACAIALYIETSITSYAQLISNRYHWFCIVSHNLVRINSVSYIRYSFFDSIIFNIRNCTSRTHELWMLRFWLQT